MRIGIFADTHDHVVNIRRAVERFNAERVDLALFAGDLVSTIAVPPLRQLRNLNEEFDIAVFSHMHKPRIECDDRGRLLINPGETRGWSFGLGDAQHGFPYLSGAGRLVIKDAIMMGAALVTMADSANSYLKRRAGTAEVWDVHPE